MVLNYLPLAPIFGAAIIGDFFALGSPLGPPPWPQFHLGNLVGRKSSISGTLRQVLAEAFPCDFHYRDSPSSLGRNLQPSAYGRANPVWVPWPRPRSATGHVAQ